MLITLPHPLASCRLQFTGVPPLGATRKKKYQWNGKDNFTSDQNLLFSIGINEEPLCAVSDQVAMDLHYNLLNETSFNLIYEGRFSSNHLKVSILILALERVHVTRRSHY